MPPITPNYICQKQLAAMGYITVTLVMTAASVLGSQFDNLKIVKVMVINNPNILVTPCRLVPKDSCSSPS